MRALAVTMAGTMVSIVLLVIALSRLNRFHSELLDRRDRTMGSSALEVILVSSAGIGVVAFGIWFFLFAGTSPVPLNISF
jgi:hypothetical protein